MRGRAVAAWTLAAMVLCAAPAAAQRQDAPRPAPGGPESRAIFAALDADPQIQSLFATCPADLYGRARAAGRSWLPRSGGASPQCGADPAACHEACLSGSGSACFNLARWFQRDEEAVPQRYAEMLFAAACGFGHAGGCTNRGSGIRNSLPRGDPFARADDAVKEACQFRTFQLSCRQEDAWGCAMLGQSYQKGEGVVENASLARSALLKSCQISPTFEACAFARRRLNELVSGRAEE